ncbi:MAG: hypothetical protein H7A34_07940 [bacterium]|nr:hypothetical protein [bacterium]
MLLRITELGDGFNPATLDLKYSFSRNGGVTWSTWEDVDGYMKMITVPHRVLIRVLGYHTPKSGMFSLRLLVYMRTALDSGRNMMEMN